MRYARWRVPLEIVGPYHIDFKLKGPTCTERIALQHFSFRFAESEHGGQRLYMSCERETHKASSDFRCPEQI